MLWKGFISKEKFLLAFFIVGFGEFKKHPNRMLLLFDLSPQSRDGIGVMYHGQVILAPVLTVEWNDHVTLSKPEATPAKGNKETANDQHFLFLKCYGFV